MKQIYTCLIAILLTGCAGEEVPVQPAGHAMTMVVSGESWQGETVSLTRSDGSMLTALMTSGDGFGMYAANLGFTNQQVTWNSTDARWDYGDAQLWPAAGIGTVTAYAPYVSAAATPITSLDDGSLTVAPEQANAVDVLWAAVTSSDPAHSLTLNFKHALAKLSFGSVINNSGYAVTLTSIVATGTLYTSGTLSLADGLWTGGDTAERTYTMSPLSIAVASGATVAMNQTAILQIPGPPVTVTLTLTSDAYGTETVTKTITLEQGINKTVNLTIGLNHEVVMSE